MIGCFLLSRFIISHWQNQIVFSLSFSLDALDSKFSDESDDLADEGITGPERGYRGPHLVFPLQKKDIDTLIELFRKKKVLFFLIFKWFMTVLLDRAKEKKTNLCTAKIIRALRKQWIKHNNFLALNNRKVLCFWSHNFENVLKNLKYMKTLVFGQVSLTWCC